MQRADKPDASRSRSGAADSLGMAGGSVESVGGFLPLRIYIPATGQLLRFEKRLVMREGLTVTAKYQVKR